MNTDLQKAVSQLRISLLRYKLLSMGQRRRRIGVREIFKQRSNQGDGHNLINEMRLGDPEMFFNYTRMTQEMFDTLLRMVGPQLVKRNMYTTITEAQRLSLTLRFLAAGDSQPTLSFAYRCAQSTVSVILKETLPIIAAALETLYVKAPSTMEEWASIASAFEAKWNMPNCIGAIDGKHVNIQAPKASGSLYFNYKKTFSIVLLAVCDANYCFTVTEIGAEGSRSDAAIFNESKLGENISRGTLSIPSPRLLPGSDILFPYYFVGDAAFPLKQNLMKPYGVRNLDMKEAVFNYRLSRARRVIENSFGILTARWRILRQPICTSVDTAQNIVRAVVALHNYIMKKKQIGNTEEEYCPAHFVDTESESGEVINGEWRSIVQGSVFTSCERLGARNATKNILKQRDILANYLLGVGQVPWQTSRVQQGYWGATMANRS